MRRIERQMELVLELSKIYLHKIGTRECLANCVSLSNPTGDDAKEHDEARKRRGLEPIEHSASVALDSTTNGRVTPENIHGYTVRGNYRVVEIDYGHFPGDCTGLSFREYVSLGRPKAIRVSTRTRIKPVE